MTQQDLADLVGIHRTALSKIESGAQRVPIYLLYALADVMHIEASTLLSKNAEVEIWLSST